MKTKDYLQIFCKEMHSTVMATVNEQGLPVTRVIDVMLADEETIYFLTAKGKSFYEQLMIQQYVSISGTCGGEGMDKKEASLHMKAISIWETVENIGTDKLDEIFIANPYMAAIYPDEASRTALQVFKIKTGQGEFFDLYTKPITRGSFWVGTKSEVSVKGGYLITDKCQNCGECSLVCPSKCIETKEKISVIQQKHCLHCGNCFSACPFGAIEEP